MAIKKYSKVKFTLRKELIFIVVGLALLGLGIGLLSIQSKSEKFYKEWTSAGATSLAEEHIFSYTTTDSLEKKVVGNTNSGLVYVLYGTSSDESSRTLLTSVQTSATNAEVKSVLVLDSAFASEKDRKEDTDFDAKLTEIETKLGLSSYEDSLQAGVEDKFEASLDNAPSLWVYNNGVLVYVINTQLYNAESSSYDACLIRAFAFAYPQAQ